MELDGGDVEKIPPSPDSPILNFRTLSLFMADSSKRVAYCNSRSRDRPLNT